jgi:hypothetical protein
MLRKRLRKGSALRARFMSDLKVRLPKERGRWSRDRQGRLLGGNSRSLAASRARRPRWAGKANARDFARDDRRCGGGAEIGLHRRSLQEKLGSLGFKGRGNDKRGAIRSNTVLRGRVTNPPLPEFISRTPNRDRGSAASGASRHDPSGPQGHPDCKLRRRKRRESSLFLEA